MPRLPEALVKQANIAHGPQQVNNGVPAQTARGASSIFANQSIGGPTWQMVAAGIVEAAGAR